MTSKKKEPNKIYDAMTMIAAMRADEIHVGDRVHVGVVGPGQVLEDAYWTDCINGNVYDGLILTLGKRKIELPWGDIIELWAISASPTGQQNILTTA